MDYTYSSYENLIETLICNGYKPIRFCDVSDEIRQPAIIRHDVDMDLQKAERMADLENRIGIRSTYFVLLSSEYYNIFSSKNMKSIQNILNCEHEIGLHFDIATYKNDLSLVDLKEKIGCEKSLMEKNFGIEIKSLSWHIPRKDLLGKHLEFLDELGGVLNAYDPYFYNGFKYVSDSMMRWREPLLEYVKEKKYNKLQILTHPIWYRNEQDMTAIEILEKNLQNKICLLSKYLDTIRPGFDQNRKFSSR